MAATFFLPPGLALRRRESVTDEKEIEKHESGKKMALNDSVLKRWILYLGSGES